MRRTGEPDSTTALLRGLVALIAEQQRRQGVTGDEIAAVLARCEIPNAELAAVLGTTRDGARMAVQRGRGRPKRRRNQIGRTQGNA